MSSLRLAQYARRAVTRLPRCQPSTRSFHSQDPELAYRASFSRWPNIETFCRRLIAEAFHDQKHSSKAWKEQQAEINLLRDRVDRSLAEVKDASKILAIDQSWERFHNSNTWGAWFKHPACGAGLIIGLLCHPAMMQIAENMKKRKEEEMVKKEQERVDKMRLMMLWEEAEMRGKYLWPTRRSFSLDKMGWRDIH